MTEECPHCGESFQVKGVRQLVRFEDFAESSAIFDWFHLCNSCWWAIYDTARGRDPLPGYKHRNPRGGDGA